MKLITHTLSDFLEKHISNKLSNAPHLSFSEKTYGILKPIFIHLKDAEDSYMNNIHSIREQWVDTGLLKGDAYSYCSADIRKVIEDTYYHQCRYTFKIKNRDIIVALIYPQTKTKKQASHFFKESIKRVYMWIYIASIFAPVQCANNLNIYLYFTDLKKVLPNNGNIIEQIHANTAFTTSCSKNIEIHIYREEEWFKVLIHESFHCFGLDFSEFDCTNTTKYILNIFPVKSDVLLFETYCEMWAEILNVMFISYFSTKQKENIATDSRIINKMMKKIEIMLEKEQEFSLFQCVKVLHFYGLTYNDLHDKSIIAHTKRTNKYREKSNVLSYYILKSIYMFFVNDFLEWCADHNNNSINFNKNKNVLNKNMNDYCNFIAEHYSNPLFVESITGITDWFDKMNNKYILKKMESRTLRMSVFEI